MLTTLTSSDFGLGYELFPKSRRLARKFAQETGHESILVQADWDFPGLARNLGWNMGPRRTKQGVCYHRSTDGTVNCRDCGKSAGAFIDEAREYLDRKIDGSYRGLDDYFGF